MKKLYLAIAISAIYSPAFAARLAIVEIDGDYYVNDKQTPDDYFTQQEEILDKSAVARINAIPTDKGIGYVFQETNNINNEKTAAIRLLETKVEYAKKAINYVKSGEMPLNVAKEKAAEETYGEIESDVDTQTGYNDSSVSSELSKASGSEAVEDITTTTNSDFKQFNELDCTYAEVSNYVDKSLSNQSKAFSTPKFSTTFKNTQTAASSDLDDDEGAACQTIFHDLGMMDETEEESFAMPSMSEMWDSVPDVPSVDMMGAMVSTGWKAAEIMVEEAGQAALEMMKKSLCERGSTSYLTDLAGSIVDEQYSNYSDNTALQGTKITKLDSESSQNNFTYKVIKNQSKLSDSNLIKSIDVTRNDQGKYQEKFIQNQADTTIDGQLDALTDSIF